VFQCLVLSLGLIISLRMESRAQLSFDANAITYRELVATGEERFSIGNDFSNSEIYEQYLFEQDVC